MLRDQEVQCAQQWHCRLRLLRSGRVVLRQLASMRCRAHRGQCLPRRAAVRWAARHAATEVPDIVLTQLPTAALQERAQLQAQGDTKA